MSVGIPRIDSSLVIGLLLILPIVIAILPILISYLQDRYPGEVDKGNPLFILFSGYLDRKGISAGQSPHQIMHSAIQRGTEQLVDDITTPAIVPIKDFQRALTQSLQSIRTAIQKAVTLPTRALYNMGTSLTVSLNKMFMSVAGSVTGIFGNIQKMLDNLINGTIVGLYFQATGFNLAVSGIKFFLFIVELAGIATVAIGMMFMASLFLIPVGLPLLVIGAVLTAIAVDSQGVMRAV